MIEAQHNRSQFRFLPRLAANSCVGRHPCRFPGRFSRSYLRNLSINGRGRPPRQTSSSSVCTFPVGLLSIVFASLMLFACVQNAMADQTDPELPALFSALEAAETADDANRLETRIWQLWLQSPDEKADAFLQRIVSAMGQGDLDDALTASDELVQYAPDFAEGWNKRATVHYLMGNFNSSVEDIYRTLKLEPRHFGAISGLGLIFLKQGNAANALQAFEQVLAVSPKSINARRSVEQVRKQLGEEI